jgi:hypothetical protein
MYQFQIFYHNHLVVREYYKTLEEAKAAIKSWNWEYNPDDCAFGLYEEVSLNYKELEKGE